MLNFNLTLKIIKAALFFSSNDVVVTLESELERDDLSDKEKDSKDKVKNKNESIFKFLNRPISRKNKAYLAKQITNVKEIDKSIWEALMFIFNDY